MAKAKIILLKIKKNKDGTNPVCIRLSYGSARNYIFLGYSCKPEQWNEGISRFESNYKKHKLHNQILSEKEQLMDEIMEYFEKRNLNFSVELFKKKFQRKHPDKMTVFEYFQIIIKELNEANRLGYAGAYKDAKSALERYFKGDRLTFQDIDITFLRKYKAWLRMQPNKYGDPVSDRTVSAYLRILRVVYYRAIDEGLVSEELNPFGKRKFSINEGLNMKTRKRAISKSDILKIYNYKGELTDTKNIFIFSYLTGGMNFTDIAYLKWSNIKNGRIEYKRKKTGKEYSIKITDPIRAILDQYKGREYVFPIIHKHHKTASEKQTRIKTAIKKFNQELRDIAREVGIEAHLTSYVARHSMATVLYKEEGASVAYIKEFMGHSEDSTTQAYLDSIDQSEKDKLQDKLL